VVAVGRRQKNGELVSSDAGDAGCGQRPDAAGHFAQAGIARIMPRRVVDVLEPVEVEHHQAHRRAGRAACLHPRENCRAVGHPRQRVDLGKPAKGVTRFLLGGNVLLQAKSPDCDAIVSELDGAADAGMAKLPTGGTEFKLDVVRRIVPVGLLDRFRQPRPFAVTVELAQGLVGDHGIALDPMQRVERLAPCILARCQIPFPGAHIGEAAGILQQLLLDQHFCVLMGQQQVLCADLGR
jgi:hypothetical protein